MDHSRVAQTVLKAVGGPDNINAAAHCATRLRLVLADPGVVDQATLDNDPDIKGTFSTGGMFQIIVGPGDVNIVFQKMVESGVKEATKEQAKEAAAKQGNWLVQFIKVLSDVFVPILPALIAGGLMMALNNILTAPGMFWFAPPGQGLTNMWPALRDVAEMVNMFAAAPFAFLPVLIGFSATKRFGGNPYLGAAMGAAMVFPSLVNGYGVAAAVSDGSMAYWDIFGIAVAQAGYQGQVIPVLFVSYLLATIEKWLHKVLKGTTDFLLTPLITLITTGFITFMLLGPLTRQLSDAITFGLQWMYESGGMIGGLIFATIYSPIVITGLHQSFPAIDLALIAQGGTFIFPIAAVANIAQGAATLAVFAAAKDGKLKAVAGASGTSALMGITEPAIFGVNLRLRWPFFIAMGAAGIGGALVSLFDIVALSPGPAGLIGFIAINPPQIPIFMVVAITTFILGFVATFLYARTRGKASIAGTHVDETSEEESAAAERADDDFTVTTPMAGKLVPLNEVKDPTFAAAILGPGAAVMPSEGPVVSPVTGEVVVAFPTHHAYGLKSDSGVEILIHIGMDTVQLNGEHFSSKVKVGQRVRRGTVLAEVDWEAVAKAGYDLTTPVVVTNAAGYESIEAADRGMVLAGAGMLTVTPKPAEVEQPA